MTLYELIDHLSELAHHDKAGATTVASIVLALASKCAAMEALHKGRGFPSEDDVAKEIKDATVASLGAFLAAEENDYLAH